LVTGASRGIGYTIATTLADQGFFVLGTATSSSGQAAIDESLGNGRGWVLDLGQPETIDAAVQDIQDQHGPISVLINNAGITRDQLLLRLKDEDWQAVLETNLTGTMRLTRACLKGMVKNRHGRIVSVSSVVASTGNPGQTNYAAAKAGLEGFSRALALEVAARGITCNVVAPGFIATDMTAQLSDEQRERLLETIPAKRLGDAADVAALVAFLASPAAGYITGQTLHVNGGMYLT
jgi:3-oxoacyl-[acyl-carrier protein] reductase